MFERDESKNVELTAEQAALERQLARLDVAPLHIDRDRLMFEAGRAAGRSERDTAATLRVAGTPRWIWLSAAAALAAACLVLSAMLFWPDDSALVAQREPNPQAADAPDIEAPTPAELREVERLANTAGNKWFVRPRGGYLEKRYIALTQGVGELQSDHEGVLPPSTGSKSQPTTARELLRELVPQDVSTPDANS